MAQLGLEQADGKCEALENDLFQTLRLLTWKV